MPFIHIKSLPLEEEFDVSKTLKNIAKNFSNKTGINLNLIHTTWDFYQPGHYAKGEQVADFQPKENYPIIVDLLTPDFNKLEVVEVMLESIAESISQQLHYPKNNIFINHRQAQSAMVFDDGEIVKW